MKVYVITAGEYSDYHIVGVTTDKSKAKKIHAIHTRFNIETYDTDKLEFNLETIDNILSQGNRCYKVHYNEYKYEMYGDTFKVEPIDSYGGYFDDYNENVQKCIDGYVEEYDNYFNNKYSYDFYIITKDEQHALKIAQDKYAKLKAEKLNL